MSVVVKDYEFTRPDTNEIDSITDKWAGDC